jgi:glutamine synthetase
VTVAKEIRDRLEREQIEFVELQFTDIPGTLKTVTVPAARLDACFERGLWFDGSAVEGLARVVESDLYLRPDAATFQVVPWAALPTARLIADLTLPNGDPFPADPRGALRTVVASATDAALEYRASCELEFTFFRAERGVDGQLQPIDRGGYFDATTSPAEQVCRDAAGALERMGIAVHMSHHEVGPGQHEIDLEATEPVALADAITSLRTALRAYAPRRGLLATFMPKPTPDAAGSGMHVQQHLRRRDGSDAFRGTDDTYGLSPAARHFIAGQLEHARGMCAVIAPLVNSYKRLMGGWEAPAHISWARRHRGSYIRVPEAREGQATIIEVRAADASANPYLALAVMLAAGLDGIQRELPLADPVEEPPVFGHRAAREELAELLPRTLSEALEAIDWDPLVRTALGQPIYERFVVAKEREWRDYQRSITGWEVENYLNAP